MGVKTLNFKVNLKSTTPELIYSRHKVYTNDDNAVKLEFAVQDFTAEELTTATASLLLYMRDGSFFQIEDANITKSGSTFSYTLQGTQGKHDGVAQAQLLVTIGAAELATQKYEFEIISGLDQAVAVEVMIQDWTTLTAEARAFIDQAELDEAQRISNENARIAAENQRINDFSSKADKTYVDQQDSEILAQLNDLTQEKVQNFKLKNEVVNGDFSQGIAEWFSIGGLPSVLNNTMQLTGNGTSVHVSIREDRVNTILQNGRKEYARVRMRVRDNQAQYIRMRLYAGLSDTTINAPIQDQWYSVSAIMTGNQITEATPYIRFQPNSNYADPATANGKVFEIEKPLIIDLTTIFGAGNEPTKLEMDELMKVIPSNWWDGEITLTQKQYVIWKLNLWRKTTNAIIALGGTII